MAKLVLICGVLLLFHFSVKWLEARQAAEAKGVLPPGLSEYIAKSPAQTLVAVLGAVSSFLMVDSLDWMNPGMAGACGYMGSSIAENVVNQFKNVTGSK